MLQRQDTDSLILRRRMEMKLVLEKESEHAV